MRPLSLLWFLSTSALLHAAPVSPWKPSSAIFELNVTLQSANGITKYSKFLAHKGDNLEEEVQKFLKATSILPEEAEAFRQAIQRETIVAGVVIQWKIVVCLANGTAELQSRLLSAIATFPEADIVVLVANGFAITEQQVNHLSKPTQEIFHGKLLFESATQAEPPEQALVRIWDLLPVGVKLVAFCIKECEPPIWPLMSTSSRWLGQQFLHHARIAWSFRRGFNEPLVSAVLGNTATKLGAYPSLVLFSSETIVWHGLPNTNDGGIMAWVDAARRRSTLYVGNRRDNKLSGGPVVTSTVSSRLPPPSTQLLRFNILVVLGGRDDATTALVFKDIANIVDDGLQSLGHSSRIVYCTNLATDRCFDEGELVIVLAPQNLAAYISTHGTLAALEGRLLPRDAVLYNFEYVPNPRHVSPASGGTEQRRGRDRTLVCQDVLKIYGDGYKVWEYAEENFQHLLSTGIDAELVPLGFSSRMRSSTFRVKHDGEQGVEQLSDETIDVLFVGLETPSRKAIIDRIRAAGITVVHPNAAGIELFGEDFDAASAKSKIVLSLNAFETPTGNCATTTEGSCNHGEWKISRLARLLANSRFVIAQMSGSTNERKNYMGGVIFASSDSLAETCKYYLQRPRERMAIANRGREIYERQNEADILRGPIEAILSRVKETKTQRKNN